MASKKFTDTHTLVNGYKITFEGNLFCSEVVESIFTKCFSAIAWEVVFEYKEALLEALDIRDSSWQEEKTTRDRWLIWKQSPTETATRQDTASRMNCNKELYWTAEIKANKNAKTEVSSLLISSPLNEILEHPESTTSAIGRLIKETEVNKPFLFLQMDRDNLKY